jgi:transposase InsO family protein
VFALLSARGGRLRPLGRGDERAPVGTNHAAGTQWKTELLQRAAEVFATPAEKREAGPDVKTLHAKIGHWHSRRVLAWRLSNSMTAYAPVEALEEAIAKYGPPQIINRPGRQFTSREFITTLEQHASRP